MRTVRELAWWGFDHSLPSLVSSSALAMGVLVAGPLVVGEPVTHKFLAWNLALAWIPFVAAVGVEAFDRRGYRRPAIAAAVVWLLFLPNAPYLVSDLTHLRYASETPWLDLARLFAFAWAGCVLCAASLRIVHGVVAGHLGRLAGWALVLVAAAACGVGVAIGRFARLNSWEVATRPDAVGSQTLHLAVSAQAVSVALFFAALVLVSYVAFASPRRGGQLR